MIILLSPSKRLNSNESTSIRYGNEPIFIKDSEKLMKLMRKFSINDLMKLMSISYNLAETNYNRFREWEYPFDKNKARPAFATFAGDLYDGLKANELNLNQVNIADNQVRILSGLYGILKPTDIIMPYRLEMGTELKGRNFNSLYDFWKIKLTKYLMQELRLFKKKIIVNLASVEYSKAIDFRRLDSMVVNPFFLEYNNGDYKFISINAKRARGLMTRYIIDKKIDEVEQLKLFDYNGYSYDEQRSIKNRWVFIR